MCSPEPCSWWARGEQETDHTQGRALMQDNLEKISENLVLAGDVSLGNSAKSGNKLS